MGTQSVQQGSVISGGSAANQNVISTSNPAQGIFEIDVQIISTLTTALQIELFNAECSQFEVANAGVNNFVPLAGFYLGANSIALGGQGNQHIDGVFFGSNDIYINAGAITPAAASNNVCFFDLNGNAIYQPGFLAGAQVAGNVTISVTQPATNYRHVFNWSKANAFDLHSAQITYSETNQIQNPLLITSRNVRGTTNTDQINVQNSKSNQQFNPLLLNPVIGVRMLPSVGIRWNITQGVVNANVQTIQANFYYSVKDEVASAIASLKANKQVLIYKADKSL